MHKKWNWMDGNLMVSLSGKITWNFRFQSTKNRGGTSWVTGVPSWFPLVHVDGYLSQERQGRELLSLVNDSLGGGRSN